MINEIKLIRRSFSVGESFSLSVEIVKSRSRSRSPSSHNTSPISFSTFLFELEFYYTLLLNLIEGNIIKSYIVKCYCVIFYLFSLKLCLSFLD